LFARQLLSLFLPAQSTAIDIAVHINYIVGWSFILMGVSMVLTFLVRANGAVLAPLLILIFSSVLVRFSVGFGLYPQFGADAIWWAFIAASIASMVFSVAYYLLGKWRELSVLDSSVPVAVIAQLE
jgi:Na+-driven multidrug efflux pump